MIYFSIFFHTIEERNLPEYLHQTNENVFGFWSYPFLHFQLVQTIRIEIMSQILFTNEIIK